MDEPTRGRGGAQGAEARESAAAAPPEVVTLTTDPALQAGIATLTAVLRAHGCAVAVRSFLHPTDAHGVVLLTLRRPVQALLPLVVPPTAPAGLAAALDTVLFGAAPPGTSALLQLKADDAFVSINARDGADLTRALGLLRTVVSQTARRPVAQLTVAGERRFVYGDGVWQVYGVREQAAFVFDAAANRLVVAP